MTSRTERTEELRTFDFRASDDSDGTTLEGYAAVINQRTKIRDSAGEFYEQFRPGSLKRSLAQKTPVMQFDHGTHPLLGSLPLGTYSVAREDKNGMFVRGRMSKNWLIEPFRDAIRDGAVTGMSVRMRVINDEWTRDEDGNELRDIIEAEILEAGPVVWPAYTTTSVAVRSLVGALDTETRGALKRELVEDRFEHTTANDTAAALRSALVNRFSPNEDQWVWVRDHTDVVVIFDLEGFDDSGTFRLDYTLDENGAVTLADADPTPVVAQTTYVDVQRHDNDTSGTSAVAAELADDDGPDEPPVASHEANRDRITAALARFRHNPPQETPDVHE